MIRKNAAVCVFGLLVASIKLSAQGPPPGGPPDGMGGHPPPHRGPGFPGPMDRSVHVGPPGRWWSDPRLVQLLQLTPNQQRSMDKVFEQSRSHLIELNDTLRREEATLRPLVSADSLDEQKILIQIDRVANARAELEKANGRMLIDLRKVLNNEQWHRLQEDDPRNRMER